MTYDDIISDDENFYLEDDDDIESLEKPKTKDRRRIPLINSGSLEKYKDLFKKDENSEMNSLVSKKNDTDFLKKLSFLRHYSSSSFQRPVDWRWNLAEELLKNSPVNQKPSYLEDEWVQKAIDFLSVVDLRFCPEELKDTEKRLENIKQFPENLIDAYLLKFNIYPDNEKPLNRNVIMLAHLEALILAGKKREKIAKLFNLSEDTIFAYEKWWFDVRDRLSAKGWIISKVIGPIHSGGFLTNLTSLIKAYGYYSRSIRIVNSVVSLFDDKILGARSNPDIYFTKDKITSLGIKSSLVSKLYGVHPETFDLVMKAHDDAINTLLRYNQLTNDDNEKRRDEIYEILVESNSKSNNYLSPPKELTAEQIKESEEKILSDIFSKNVLEELGKAEE